jgi:hypothetical protein
VNKPLHLILDKSLKMDQTSRINFSKLYTVEYNIKVSTVGRIVNQDHHLLDEYVAQSIVKLDVESGRGKSRYEETEDEWHLVQQDSLSLQTEDEWNHVQQDSLSQQTEVATIPPTSAGVPNWRWWIPAKEILREIIQADIQRYLGPEALVKPGNGTGEYAVSH